MIRAVLFDLDGTLLPHDFDVFLRRYLGGLRAWFAEHAPGIDVVGPVMATGEAMLRSDGQRTLEEVCVGALYSHFPAGSRGRLEPLFWEFYRRAFPALGAGIVPDPSAARAVSACRDRGVTVVLATNPVFPPIAIEERARWAGLDLAQFDLVASWDMHQCKPHPGYYAELAAAIALPASECLMIGNDVAQDLRPAAQVGMRTCLVTGEYQALGGEPFAVDASCPLPELATLLATMLAGPFAGERDPRPLAGRAAIGSGKSFPARL